ncbi:MAG: lysine--tRNA ligase, partial [Gloeobacteraceae cyanobacterium ES-bin-316]|nr:lysine--tRNA ligase [Ferruginibacter sp.]
MNTAHLSEQEIIRREKLEELNKLGIDAYPAALYPVNTTSAYIKENYKGEENKQDFAEVCIAGRIMSVRDMGKANFAVLQDGIGKIQFYIRQDDICPDEDKSRYQLVWKKLLDLGDIIGVKGFVFTTKTGETSIHVKEFSLLSKSLKPLPVVREKEGETFDEVTDPEFRYRQRYADLIVNPGVKEVFIKRTKMINAIREFLNERGGLEVDTPVLQSIPGGAAARPFSTHHNALDVPMYMRIANELYLKRLIVGGFEWVYEFS